MRAVTAPILGSSFMSGHSPTAEDDGSQKRHLLFVAPFAAEHGGLEQYLVDLVDLADTNGWRLTVVAPRGVPASSWLRQSLPIGARWVAADRAVQSGPVKVILATMSGIGRALARVRGGAYGDPMNGRIGRFLIEEWFWRTSGRSLLAEADLVHLLGKPKPFVQRAITAGTALRKTMIYTEVAQVTPSYSRRPDLAGFTAVAHDLAVVTTYYAEQGRDIRALFAYEGRIEVIEQWVDADVEPALLALAPPAATNGARAVTFGTLSRLSPEKGLPWLVEAFAELRRGADLDVRLVIGGTGPEEAAIRSKIASLGLEETVTLAGYVDDKVRFLERIDVFMVTSEVEGGPISGLEAIAAGRLVISTPVGAMPDRLTASTDGELVDYGKIDQLASAMSVMAKRLQSGQPAGDLRARYRTQHAQDILQDRMACLWDEFVPVTSV